MCMSLSSTILKPLNSGGSLGSDTAISCIRGSLCASYVP